MTFLKDSISLFTGKSVAHMGAYQYSDHRGIDKFGRSMSGARLWAEAESPESRRCRAMAW